MMPYLFGSRSILTNHSHGTEPRSSKVPCRIGPVEGLEQREMLSLAAWQSEVSADFAVAAEIAGFERNARERTPPANINGTWNVTIQGPGVMLTGTFNITQLTAHPKEAGIDYSLSDGTAVAQDSLDAKIKGNTVKLKGKNLQFPGGLGTISKFKCELALVNANTMQGTCPFAGTKVTINLTRV